MTIEAIPVGVNKMLMRDPSVPSHFIYICPLLDHGPTEDRRCVRLSMNFLLGRFREDGIGNEVRPSSERADITNWTSSTSADIILRRQL